MFGVIATPTLSGLEVLLRPQFQKRVNCAPRSTPCLSKTCSETRASNCSNGSTKGAAHFKLNVMGGNKVSS